MSTKLETELFNELVELYKKTRTELYNPATFWVALGQDKWLKHVKNFIKNPTSDGIEKLIAARRPDLSIEYLIVNNEKYHELFKEELDICKQTLDYINKACGK